MIYCRYGFKRLLDVLLSTSALILLGPLIVIGALAVKASSRGPAFFVQMRVGRQGRLFRILKLRTMPVDPRRKIAQTHNADPDVLPVGRVLRRLKIDELPQILNVLVGDMSIVGPRPCLEQTYSEMPEWARKRFEVRPGITGLAQINGNIALTWEDRWRHDIHYVETCSLLGDLGIVAKTVAVVVVGEERFRKTR